MLRGKQKADETIGLNIGKQTRTFSHTTQYSYRQHTSTSASSSKLLTALGGAPTTLIKPLKRKKDEDAFPEKYGNITAPDLPAPKKKRKTKDPNAPVPEKRSAIFKKKCPQNILERVDRVISQRFFMIDRTRQGGELREEFQVLGSTGNVYTVTIDKRPSCSCPDSQKGNHCKHILFVFLKVLQVPQHSTHWYQKALLTSELEELFRDAPLAPNAMAHASIREAYARATGKASPVTTTANSKRMPNKDDDCPICYEGMHGLKAATLSWCQSCGNALHKECFQQWERSSRQKGGPTTCVYCRAVWAGSASTSKAKGSISEGYINLSSAAGLSPQRDTSSYYHGPRRGQRYYGYQEYDYD